MLRRLMLDSCAGAFIIAALAGYRRQLARKDREAKSQASQLIPVIYDMLRNRQLEHLADPNLEPFISDARLRDSLLEHEQSVETRMRIWAEVKRTMATSNTVRLNEEEFNDGTSEDAWQWVGDVNALSYDSVHSTPRTSTSA